MNDFIRRPWMVADNGSSYDSWFYARVQDGLRRLADGSNRILSDAESARASQIIHNKLTKRLAEVEGR